MTEIRNTHSQIHKKSAIYSQKTTTEHLKKNEFSKQYSMTAVGRCMCTMTMKVQKLLHYNLYCLDDIPHAHHCVFLAHMFTSPSAQFSCHPKAVVL